MNILKNKFIKWFILLILALMVLAVLSLLKVIGIPEKCFATGDIGHCDTIFSPEYWKERSGSWNQTFYLVI